MPREAALANLQTPPPPWLRGAVRGVLEQSAGYQKLDNAKRRSLANAMVKVSALAAQFIGEEVSAEKSLGAQQPARRAAVARAQDAPDFGAAAQRVASTTREVLNAVSFPRFVTDLINGVFRSHAGLQRAADADVCSIAKQRFGVAGRFCQYPV